MAKGTSSKSRPHAGLIVLLAVSLVSVLTDIPDLACEPAPPLLQRSPYLQNPTDTAQLDDCFLATDLFGNRLSTSSNAPFANARWLAPAGDKPFAAPHFLYVTPRGTVLISDGWGRRIHELDSCEPRAHWKSFDGKEPHFNSPHGMCEDNEGWIYVADSLNSRIVRFRDMSGKDWQVFPDVDKRVAYVRQLVCADGSLWAANSYVDRPGLNPSDAPGVTSGSVLRIDDFGSGITDVVATFSTGTTGLAVTPTTIYVGLRSNEIVGIDRKTGAQATLPGSKNQLGVPYGMKILGHELVVAYYGDLKENGATNRGGLARFPLGD